MFVTVVWRAVIMFCVVCYMMCEVNLMLLLLLQVLSFRIRL